MKLLKDFTIQEFYDYQYILKQKKPDVFQIFELFGENANNMPYHEFEKKLQIINSQTIPMKKSVKQVYRIKNRDFKVMLNPKNITAAQFIDFQTYISKELKFEQILSIFLTPSYRTWYGLKKYHKYNQNYDIFEVQDYLLNNCTIEVAQEISDFFLHLSKILLKVMTDYSIKQKAMMMMFHRKTILSGFRLPKLLQKSQK